MIDVSDVFSHKAQRLPGFASNITLQFANYAQKNEHIKELLSSKLLKSNGGCVLRHDRPY